LNKYQEEYNLIEKLVRDKIYFSNHADFEEVIEVTKALNLLQEALDKAKKYDEKETPKKPISKRLYYNCHNGECDKTFIHYCPVCNFNSVEKDYANFCPNCGQKLDWSDTDE
jgi:uncharacterized Zn finger protein (UPF0148 family)